MLALTLAMGGPLTAFAANGVSSPSVPLPKPRPIARTITQKAASDAVLRPASTAAAALAPVNASLSVPAQAAPATGAAMLAAAPVQTPAPAAVAATASTSQSDRDALENVIQLVRKHNPAEATKAEASISDPLARKLAEWVILRSDDNDAGVERYRAFIEENPSWPMQSFLRKRVEAALFDDKREDSLVWSWFEKEKPISAKGRLALAKTMLARGDRANAARLVRETWRNDSMAADTESIALDTFGSLLTPADHKARLETLLYGSDQDGAMREAKRLGAGYVALAKALDAAYKKDPNLEAALNAVPSELRGDAGYLFARIQLLRRADKDAEAAQLMLHAPRDPAILGNVDEWWVERRLLARKMIDAKDYRTAYLIARDAAAPARDTYRTEQQFTAGWIALRFLNDPALAAQHFARIGVGSTDPTTLSRAGYWQGRAAEAQGRATEARTAYRAAAQYSTSYYGQLARGKLGLPQLDLKPAPSSRGAERLEVVRAVQLLYDLGERELAAPIFADEGENGDPQAVAGLAELARRNGDARAMLLAGKAALNRGLPFDFYAYPVTGIPQFRSIGPAIDQSVIFAIARQESSFNPADVSPAQAYGLMQVTPEAGQYVTQRAGVAFDVKKMKTDSVYNTALGAAELSGLQQDYRGSYIMTFAAYNAGRGSLSKWIERYGDPRDPKVDAVDWVELIPFSETRNYVQRVMENLQVYRARFGGTPRLQIEADLHRGTLE